MRMKDTHRLLYNTHLSSVPYVMDESLLFGESYSYIRSTSGLSAITEKFKIEPTKFKPSDCIMPVAMLDYALEVKLSG